MWYARYQLIEIILPGLGEPLYTVVAQAFRQMLCLADNIYARFHLRG
jgi:hypothetical protein